MVALRKIDQITTADHRQQAIDLIEHITSQARIITFPIAFLGLLDNQHDACILLNQILYWSSRTNNHQGWFYKSYDDWMTEIGLSRYKINKALDGDKRTHQKKTTLRQIGVETRVIKAPTGNPTVHYRIEMPVFLAHLEAYLENQQKPICNIVTQPSETESQTDLQQSHTSSINIEKQSIELNSENQIPTERLNPIFFPYQDTFGSVQEIPASTIKHLNAHLQRLGEENIKTVLERCTEYGKSWRYVLTALKNENTRIDPLESETTQPIQTDVTVCWSDFTDIPVVIPTSEKRNSQRPQIIASRRIVSSENIKKGTSSDAWKQIVSELELHLDAETFHECIRQLVLVDYEPTTFTFTVVAPHQLAYTKALRYQRNIKAIMRAVLGEQPKLIILTCDEWGNSEQ